MDVLVIGGGAVGCSIAYHLQRSGARTTLAERASVGSGASSAAAGMLAPLAESREPGPFARLAQLGLLAFQQHGEELADESGIDIEYRRNGILRVAERESEASELRASLAWHRAAGARLRWIDGAELAAMEPSLSHGVSCALLAEGEGHVNPARLTTALATAAARRGAVILEGCGVEGFEREGSRLTAARTSSGRLRFDHVVIAGGAWSNSFKHDLQVDIPIRPVRGQMAALFQVPAPIGRIIYSHNGYLVPKSDGSLYVGATEEAEAGYDTSVTAAGLHWLLDAAMRLVPALATARYLRSWSGLRPVSADRQPVLGPLASVANATVATGHFRNGILLSLVTGRLIAELVTTGRTPDAIEAFTPSRFTLGARSR